eukprot:4303758-Amphidinium_carterae.1
MQQVYLLLIKGALQHSIDHFRLSHFHKLVEICRPIPLHLTHGTLHSFFGILGQITQHVPAKVLELKKVTGRHNS